MVQSYMEKLVENYMEFEKILGFWAFRCQEM